MRRAVPRAAGIGAGILALGAAWAGLAAAQSPPGPPSFAYVFGRVSIGGENIAPEVQPVLALVNGHACGGNPAQTFVATEGEDVPDEDVGRTVYVIDVLADGTNNYEQAGCGRPGDPIILYFPESGRMASVQPLFQAGPIRADVELDVVLGNRAALPALASDAAE